MPGGFGRPGEWHRQVFRNLPLSARTWSPICSPWNERDNSVPEFGDRMEHAGRMQIVVNFLTGIFSWLKNSITKNLEPGLDTLPAENLQAEAFKQGCPDANRVPSVSNDGLSNKTPIRDLVGSKLAETRPKSSMPEKTSAASHPWHDLSAGEVCFWSHQAAGRHLAIACRTTPMPMFFRNTGKMQSATAQS